MIVKHPTLKGVERDVPDGDASRWVAAGWLPLGDDPCTTTNDTPARREHAGRRTSEAATAADQGQHSDEGDK